MLRVICGHCGKKLEMPDAWARNVVKCPQCREPINLQDAASAEGVVKLGQFLKENLAGPDGPGGKFGPAGRPPAAGHRGPLGSLRAVLGRHVPVVTIVALAALLIVLDVLLFHTVTVALGALAGGVIAVAAWHSEATSHLPSAVRRAEFEFKIAVSLVVVVGLWMAWFCYVETSKIIAAKDLASVASALELLPKWAAIVVVFLAAGVVMGGALGSLALVQRLSIYHVLSGGLVLFSLGYGLADVTTQQSAGVGVVQFIRQQLEPLPAGTVVSGATAAAGTASAPVAHVGVVTTDGGLASGGAVETSENRAGATPSEPEVEVWTAVADPAELTPPRISRRLPDIHLGAQSWNPVTPPFPSSWLAVGDNRREQSVRELWDLAGPSQLGKLAGKIDFVEPVSLSADEPMIAGYNPTSQRVEVWSLGDGEMVGRLDCHDIPKRETPFVAFVAPETLLVVHGQATDLHAPPACQIWNFVHDEMLAEFAVTGFTGESIHHCSISPGRGYLAVADKSLVQIYDLIERRLAGKASIPAVSANSPLDCTGLSFTRDGHEVSAIFCGTKNSRLVSWDMSDGNVVADREFNFDLARGASPDCRPLESLVGGGWLVFERIIIPPFSGKVVLASTLSEMPATGAGVPRLAMVLDSERLLVIANDALQIVQLPKKWTSSKDLLTLAQLLNVAAAGSATAKPGAKQRPMPGAGQGGGEVSDAVNRAYTRAAYIDFLTADDESINEQVRWAPWAKRPVFGLRWGLGVLPTNLPEKLAKEQLIEPVTGAVGPKLVAALDERLAAGAFGSWPPGEDSRLTRVGWLGVGKSAQLTSAAKRKDLDIMLVIYVNWGKSDQRQISIRIADVVNALPIWSSSTLKVSPPPAPGAPKASDGSDKWLADVMRQIDQKMTLQPLPDLTVEDATQSVEKLMSSKHRDLAADLVEVRTFQARHLIDDATATGCYEQLLGAGTGEKFAHGDADARREILEKVLPAN